MLEEILEVERLRFCAPGVQRSLVDNKRYRSMHVNVGTGVALTCWRLEW